MTIYDIAAEANVSPATVSRVLNDPSKVAARTYTRVKAVLDKHNYFPNAMAQGLVSNSTKTVGVLLSDVRNPHFSTAAYVLETLFFGWGYTTLLCNTGNDLTKKMDYIRILASKKVDGLVMLGSIFSNSEIEQVIRDYLSDIPIMLSNMALPMDNCYSVQVDHTVGMRMAIDHLMDRGFRRISFVKANDSINTHRKVEGFQQEMAAHKLPFDPAAQIFFTPQGPEGGRKLANAVAPSLEKKEAFIFMDDYTAIGAVSEFRKLGIDIPKRVAVIGQDNSVFSIASEPQLTTIDTKIESMSAITAKALHDIFFKNPVGNSITIYPELIVRETT